MRSLRQFLIPLSGLALTASLRAEETPAAKGRDAGSLYAANCAGCHGANLEGGKGGNLIDAEWKHGGDEADIARSIREGFPQHGMPAFRATINEADTKALVVFLKEAATRKKDPTPAQEQKIPEGVQTSQEASYRIETIADGLEVPWSLTFLPDGRMIVTERAGRLRVIENGKLRPEQIGGLPPVIVQDEGGLMSVVAHPDFAHHPWLYLTYSDPGPNDTAMTKVVRARLHDWQLVHPETIFSIPKDQYGKGYVLFGGRLVFDGDYLFFSVGARALEEAATKEAQNLALPQGKIHRVFHDGKIPPDNPFVDQSDAFASIWAYGVRNPQGLARNPVDGSLWESEHGPRGGDELNRIERGKNYGWPLVTHGMNYDGTPISDKTEAPGLESPVLHWTPSIATSEIEFYTGDKFPRWKNNLFLGSLAAQKLLRFTVEQGRVTHTEEVFKGLGRIRDIKTGPDGNLYLALELIGKPGKIIRLIPADPPAPNPSDR